MKEETYRNIPVSKKTSRRNRCLEVERNFKSVSWNFRLDQEIRIQLHNRSELWDCGPKPHQDITPHTITEPPLFFTVRTRQSTWNSTGGVRQTNTCPVVWNNVNDDSLDKSFRYFLKLDTTQDKVSAWIKVLDFLDPSPYSYIYYREYISL